MSIGILDAGEAARRLLITPELLFHYVRHGAKGRPGRKLAAWPEGPSIRFRERDLDDYDAFLKTPWGEPGGPRAAIPKGVQDYLKVEASGMCARCGAGGPLQDAHIVPWEISRSNHHHNLIRLCGNCHGLYDGKAISREEIERLKASLVAGVQDRISGTRATVWPPAGAQPMTPVLFGRDIELAAAIQSLQCGEALLVSGVGGIGKTQLALHALHAIRSERPILWISVESLNGAGLEDALRAQAAAAGIRVVNGRPLLDEARACVVFDGFEALEAGGEAVSDLLETLLGAQADTLVVVTSQATIPWLQFGRELKVGPLADDAARQLLAPVSPTDMASADLLAFAEGHPLSLRILAALVSHFRSAAHVLARLERLGAEAIEAPRRRQQSGRTSLNRCLALAFAQLGDAQKQLAWLIAISPGGLRPGLHLLDNLIRADALEAMTELQAWNLSEAVIDSALERLPATRIVLTMLSPVRAFIRQAISQDAGAAADLNRLRREHGDSVADVVTIIQSKFLQGGAVDLGKALMERELPNAVAAFDFAIDHRLAQPELAGVATRIADATMMILFTSGRFDLGQGIMRRAAEAAAAAGSLTDAVQFLYQMQILGERAFNKEVATFALAEAERIGSQADGEALALLRLIQSSHAEHRGDYVRAAERACEAYDLLQAVEEPDRTWMRSAGFSLGRALEFGGRPEEALPYYRAALDAAEEERDPINRGSTLHHIGNCEAYAGRWRAAMDAYRQAGEQFVDLDAVEFISNALGEAGYIAPHIEDAAALPGREVIRAGFEDILGQFELHMVDADASQRNPRVTARKFAGLISLALHAEELDLLEEAADRMHARLLAPFPFDADGLPDAIKFLVFQLQWMVRLMQFLGAGAPEQKLWSPTELHILARLAGSAFVASPGSPAFWLVSWLSRQRAKITESRMRALIEMEEDEAVATVVSERLDIHLVEAWLS